MNGNVKLNGIIFENLFLFPFVDIIMRDFESVCPRILYVVIMGVVVNEDVFEVIGSGRTKNWMVLYELHQEWF